MTDDFALLNKSDKEILHLFYVGDRHDASVMAVKTILDDREVEEDDCKTHFDQDQLTKACGAFLGALGLEIATHPSPEKPAKKAAAPTRRA